jgi:hypothetical protein
MLVQLRETVENRLGRGSCERAQLTQPTFLRLSEEDIEDAMEYVGLGRLPGCGHCDPLMETNAAFAGMGYGLCKHYDDIDICMKEELHRPESRVLAVSFTHTSVSATHMWMRTVWNALESYKVRFDLGLQDRPENNEEQKEYWENIRDMIVSVGRYPFGPLTHLLLLGEDANEPRFIETVQEALRILVPGELRVIGLETRQEMWSPLYVAARGAAEFAKRSQASPRCGAMDSCCEVDQLPSGVPNEEEDVLVEEL